jgi:serine protease inhibitor
LSEYTINDFIKHTTNYFREQYFLECTTNYFSEYTTNYFTECTTNYLSENAIKFFLNLFCRINEAFTKKSAETADVVNVDFADSEAASSTIKKWVNEKTKGGLKLSEINYDPSTKMVLSSAIYFKANWYFTFLPAQPGLFKVSNDKEINVQMMNMKRKFHWGKIGDYAEWASIPYKSEDSLVIILPNQNQTLENIIERMSERDFNDVLNNIDRDESEVRQSSLQN